MRRLVARTAAIASVAACAGPATAADTVSDCSNHAGPTITITSVRNVTCGRAAKAILNGPQKSISKRFDVAYGFSCGRISGGRFGGVWRCTKGPDKAFRFDFAD